MPPLISICIPALNGEPYIAAAIESCLSQTFSDFEIVVLDNGSTDRTRDIVLAVADQRVRLSSVTATVPIDQSWNLCVTRSAGEFVKLLCADDILDPQCLAHQFAALSAPTNAHAAFAFSPRRVINERGATLMRSRPLLTEDGQFPKAEALRTTIRTGRNIFGEPLAVLFRRTAFERAGGFRGGLPYCIDLDLWCRMLEYGDAVFVRHEAGGFRVSNDSLSVRLLGQQSTQQTEFFYRLYQRHAHLVALPHYIVGMCKSYLRVLARGVFYAGIGLNIRRGSSVASGT